MSSILSSAYELSSNARLATKIGPAGVAAFKSAGVSSTTTLRAGTYLQNNWNKIKTSVKSIPTLFQKPFSMRKILLYSIIFLGLVYLGLFIYKKYSSNEGFANFDDFIQKATDRINNFKVNNNPINDSENNKLLYIQPVAFKQTSYMGNGIFNEDLGILEQLRAGCRFFFLQIDYYHANLDKKLYGPPKKPVLLMRNNMNKLISKNGASLEKVFKGIRSHFNNSSIPFFNNPVVICLHFLKIPYEITDSENYKGYLNSVSEAIKVIDDIRIKGYGKASKTDELFSSDYTKFNKQIIIGTNINTSIMNGSIDLHNKINFHYGETDADTVDISDSLNENAVIYNANSLLKITDREKFIKNNTKKFIIAKPKNEENLTQEQVDILLNKMNVNVVLHDYISDSEENAKKVFNLYNNQTYKIKTII